MAFLMRKQNAKGYIYRSKGLDLDCFLGGQSLDNFIKEQQSLFESMK